MSSSRPVFFRLSRLGLVIVFSLYGLSTPLWATETIEFNTDVLDLEDKNNIDLEQFSRAGYIMPGTYSFTLKVNGEQFSEVSVPFYPPEDDPQGSTACISPEVAEQFGLTSSAKKELAWWHDGQCLTASSLPGMQIRGDLATSSLYVSIPQAYLEFTAPNWDPPSRWDEGIAALMLDYNINGNANNSYNGGHDSYALNGNGIAGVNLGAWRFRADWQGRLNHATGSGDSVNKDFDWNRFYAYRALPSLAAKLVLGEV